MRSNLNTRIPAAMLAVLFVCSTLAVAIPPAIRIQPENLNNALSDSDYKQINERINFWCEEIVEGDTPQGILKAADSLVNDYKKYPASAYRLEFAAEASKQILTWMGKVKKDDKFADSKNINLAIALTSMSQLTIQSSLNVIVAHHNPAVRYLGWKGYLSIRTIIMLKGKQETNMMLDNLADRTEQETTPLVVAEMYSVLHFPEKVPNNVSESLYREASRKALEILRKSLNAQCILYADGYLDASVTCRKSLEALKTFARINKGQNDVEDKILQSLVNVAYASAKAYQKTEGENEATKSLLLQSEDVLAEVSKENKSFIQDILVKRIDAKEKLPAIELAVVRWIKTLQDRGVGAPEFASPTETEEK